MKRTICLLMLVVSITAATYAQQEKARTIEEKTFEFPPNSINRQFTIALDKGNKMEIDLNNIDDLSRFSNIDSMLHVFLLDIVPLKDSLADDATNKRVDYVIDPSEKKKIRIVQFKTNSSSYLLQNGDVSALKLEQDTINFIGTFHYKKKTQYGMVESVRYYRLSFLVNQFSELWGYANSNLNAKISLLEKDIKTPWSLETSDWQMHLKADRSISAKHPRGFFTGPGDFINISPTLDIANYKNYFVPAFSITATLIFSRTSLRHEVTFSWEPDFIFDKNSAGNLQVYRNDFLAVSYEDAVINYNKPGGASLSMSGFSLAYLINRNGNYFDKNTFRLGAGTLSVFGGKTKIQPVMYFNNFFKDVTPGIRLIQGF